jgi:cysteine desulfurase
LNKDVIDGLAIWAQEWGNPSSIHQSGRGAKTLIREARNNFAKMINAQGLEVVFTGGGSESNNMALKGVFSAIRTQKNINFFEQNRNELLISAVEHPSIMKVAEALILEGYVVKKIPVNREGKIDLDFFAKALSEKTALVSVMYANNETGHIFPIAKMVELAHEVGAYFHCDAVQALGKAPIDVKKWNVDLASFSAHKFYALKGCGALYHKKGIISDALIHGGAQERSRRAGTENILGISALGKMAERFKEIDEKSINVKELRLFLEEKLKQEIDGLEILGESSKRLPNTTNAFIEGIDGETLLINLDIEGISVSTGAACSSGSSEPSPVLLAMGYKVTEAQKSLRLSLGWGTTRQELEIFVKTLKTLVKRIRDLYTHSN